MNWSPNKDVLSEPIDTPEPGEYFCGDCGTVERDPIFLDLETCSKCGELLDWESDEPPNPYKYAETPFADNH